MFMFTCDSQNILRLSSFGHLSNTFIKHFHVIVSSEVKCFVRIPAGPRRGSALSAYRMDCPTSRQQGAVALNGELADPWEAKGVMQGGLRSPIKILPF